MLFLNPFSRDPTTEFLVISAPVPAVVGRAIIGNGCSSTVNPLPTPSR
jgi:hypothetical protein